MTNPRTYLFGLTAEEWFSVAALGDDSELAPCCGNISNMRELVNTLMTLQDNYVGWMVRSIGRELLEAVDNDGQHDFPREIFPLFNRILDGCREVTKNDN